MISKSFESCLKEGRAEGRGKKKRERERRDSAKPFTSEYASKGILKENTEATQT